MKKTFSLLLALLLLFGLACPAYAASLKINALKKNPKNYQVEYDGKYATIYSNMSAEECSFTHKYDSPNRYSYTAWELNIVDYDKKDSYGIMVLRISYCADNLLNLNSVSFILSGKEYLFTGVTKDEEGWHVLDEKGAKERIVIMFGVSNDEFPKALKEVCGSDKAVQIAKCTMILHGESEDVTVELGTGFFRDFRNIMLAMTDYNKFDFSDSLFCSRMEVKDAAKAE